MMLRIWAVAGATLAMGSSFGGSLMPQGPTAEKSKVDQAALLRRNSQAYVENKGQWDAKSTFMARGTDTDMWLVKDGFVFSHYGTSKGHAVHMRFLGASNLEPKGVRAIAGHTDYLGDKPVRGIRRYENLRASNVYRGVDLELSYEMGVPRYDFVVEPGQNPSVIRFKLDGAKNVRVEDKTNLVYSTSIGDQKQANLRAFQRFGDKTVDVTASFRVGADGVVSFQVGRYDQSKPLVIDPLIYGSYYGGANGMDQVRAVASDATGGTFFTGATQSAFFPSTFGPFGFNVQAGWDAFVTKFQGDAYLHDYAAIIPGGGDDLGDRIQVDSAGTVWVVGSTNSGNFPGNPKKNIHYLRVRSAVPDFTHDINRGTYRIRIPSLLGPNKPTPINFDASPAEVQATITADYPDLAGLVTVTGSTTPAAGGTYTIEVDDSASFVNFVVEDKVDIDAAAGRFHMEGLQPFYQVFPLIRSGDAGTDRDHAPLQEIRPLGSLTNILGFGGAIGSFTIRYEGATTQPLPANASAGQVAGALIQAGVNPLFIDVTGGPLPESSIFVEFIGDGATRPVNRMVIDHWLAAERSTTQSGSQSSWPYDNNYVIDRPSDTWIMRFKRSAGTVLDPFEGGVVQTYHVQGPETKDVHGFGIVPISDATVESPVTMVLAGSTSSPVDLVPGSYPSPQLIAGWMLSIRYQNGAFSVVPANSRYISANSAGDPLPYAQVQGVAVDDEGSIYVAGTLVATGNSNTAIGTPIFETTPGVWQEGRLQRAQDMFVRKYSASGAIMYSTLVGGSEDEIAAGNIDTRRLKNNLRQFESAGPCIAVDRLGNAYIYGFSGSFDYPRTRGVYGEVFDTSNDGQTVVTKLNRDASSLVYSTNLRTEGGVLRPGAIAVDIRGQVYVTGSVNGVSDFFDTDQALPANVTATAVQRLGSIPTTPDALKATYTFTAAPEPHTVDGFLMVLNSSATGLVYGSYIGGILDDVTFAPYVDSFGDVWVVGWNDQYRSVTIPGNTAPTQVVSNMDAFITSLAFKEVPEYQVAENQQFDASVLETMYAFENFGGPPRLPMTLPARYRRDGYVLKMRLGLPVLANMVVDPLTIAGGDPTGGAANPSANVVVTLSDPAPAGGVTLNLTLDNPVIASFGQSQALAASTLAIPQGQTAGTFQVYSRSVLDTSEVNITADLEGNFLIRKLTVKPWLQQLSVSPNSIVGGNTSVGRVRLVQNAPAGGVTVGLASDGSGLVSVPNSVTIPAGQDSATFTITSNGVANITEVPVNASLLGVGLTQLLKLQPARMLTMTFSPDRVAAQNSTTGTISLDGVAGSTFRVILSHNGGAGYRFDKNYIDFAAGERTRTFTLITGYEAGSATRTVTATRAATEGYVAQSISGSVFVDGISVTGLSLSPTSLNGGLSSTGTVTIGAPAPSGGARVFLSSSNATYATVPKAVMVPAGQTSTTFKVSTVATPNPQVSIIRAFRGQINTSSYSYKTAQLKIMPLTMTLTVSPSEVIGGLANSTGRVTLNGNAPAAGLIVKLTSSNPAASVPATVTIPGGTRTATFAITTSSVSANTSAVIRGTIGTSNTAAASLRLLTFGVASVSFTPSTVTGGETTVFRVTLEAPAAAGGAVVQVNKGINGQIVNLPSSITIPAGQRVYALTVRTNAVSRTLTTQVSVLYRNKTVSTVLTVNPKTP